ncbi:MAG: OmcB family cysteine-rich outer membrane protein [Chlamydiales bacterium]
MVKTMRTLFAGLMLSSLLVMTSCGSWCDCFFPSCGKKCPTQCDPCPPAKCNPCKPACPPANCSPCKPACSPADSNACAMPQQKCTPAAVCVEPCAPEENPYFPCNPGVAPCGPSGCGTNACEAPMERCYGGMRSYRTNDDCVVELCQRAPEFATVGSPYPVEILITARKECAGVTVNQTLPCDSEFVKSDPPATPDKDNSLHWEFPHMKCGETQRVCVWIKPMKEGCCLAAATVCACPQLCAYTNCSQPVICIKKTGPECACINCPVSYMIEVSNSGSASAFDVVVQDIVPEGLCHNSGLKCLSFNLGTVCPGDCKRVCLNFTAIKAGCVTNTAVVSYCGGPKCSAEATTLVNEPCVEVTKTGPAWAYICKTVEYTITLTNPGDIILRDIVVDDVSGNGTTIVEAPGAQICCNRAKWCFPQLCPGETKTLKISVRSQSPGKITNKVAVTSQSDCGPCTCCAEATTLWKGIPATHMCMVDTKDPVCVGETAMYRICVTNRGSAEDTNVKLVVNFTNELQPEKANGPTTGTINGQVVEFAPIDRLAPKQSVEFCITVKGVSAGDARGEAKITSDSLKTPVVDTESTHVY